MTKWTFWVGTFVAVAALWGINYSLEEYANPYIVRVIINCGIALILGLSLNLVNG